MAPRTAMARETAAGRNARRWLAELGTRAAARAARHLLIEQRAS